MLPMGTRRLPHDYGGLKRETPGALTPGVPVTISSWKKQRFGFRQPPDCLF